MKKDLLFKEVIKAYDTFQLIMLDYRELMSIDITYSKMDIRNKILHRLLEGLARFSSYKWGWLNRDKKEVYYRLYNKAGSFCCLYDYTTAYVYGVEDRRDDNIVLCKGIFENICEMDKTIENFKKTFEKLKQELIK